MKKNNQGFMLIEALVMSTLIIGVLVYMFIQFQNISRSYDKSFSYNTVTGLYITNEIKNYLSSNNKINDLMNNVKAAEKKYIEIKDLDDATWNELLEKGNIKTVLFTDESLSKLKGQYNSSFSEKLNDYINYVKVGEQVDKYRVIIEFNDDTFASLRIGGEV